jgi:hypothetical protein
MGPFFFLSDCSTMAAGLEEGEEAIREQSVLRPIQIYAAAERAENPPNCQ